MNQKAFLTGVRLGIPVFIGYFPTALAFGLLARQAGMTTAEAFAFSVTNFAGASQFIAVNLYQSGAALGEIGIAALMINLRYLLMSASLAPKLNLHRSWIKPFIAYGITDEVFSLASTYVGTPAADTGAGPAAVVPKEQDQGTPRGTNPSPRSLGSSFMTGLIITSWSGWVTGTLAGSYFGMFLPQALQESFVITLYALFTAILVDESKRSLRIVPVAALAAGLNTVLVLGLSLSQGWAFVISMIIAAGAATLWTPPAHPQEMQEEMP
ncbi:AzlC family ABC transporter permease [Spirochaeta lutea]|uniref:Branched-chain amino acid ABC transporter permease n=1 Tax=Spirochaeta lutea TaxID=1480694 RepID=A0A098QV28_9SPIO|nr:AzlC family ABC transporter permease [Spirochaeta lutea]KGE71411.1 hypothetical protein DC28_11495 [Spirochaeta lutea]